MTKKISFQTLLTHPVMMIQLQLPPSCDHPVWTPSYDHPVQTIIPTHTQYKYTDNAGWCRSCKCCL